MPRRRTRSRSPHELHHRLARSEAALKGATREVLALEEVEASEARLAAARKRRDAAFRAHNRERASYVPSKEAFIPRWPWEPPGGLIIPTPPCEDLVATNIAFRIFAEAGNCEAVQLGGGPKRARGWADGALDQGVRHQRISFGFSSLFQVVQKKYFSIVSRAHFTTGWLEFYVPNDSDSEGLVRVYHHLVVRQGQYPVERISEVRRLETDDPGYVSDWNFDFTSELSVTICIPGLGSWPGYTGAFTVDEAVIIDSFRTANDMRAYGQASVTFEPILGQVCRNCPPGL